MLGTFSASTLCRLPTIVFGPLPSAVCAYSSSLRRRVRLLHYSFTCSAHVFDPLFPSRNGRIVGTRAGERNIS